MIILLALSIIIPLLVLLAVELRKQYWIRWQANYHQQRIAVEAMADICIAMLPIVRMRFYNWQHIPLEFCDEFMRFEEYRSEGNCWGYYDTPQDGFADISIGDLHSVTNEVDLNPHVHYLVPSLLAYGDYDNSTAMHVSNYHAFMGDFEDCEGVFQTYGGFGHRGVAIRLDCVTDAILEVFESLADYPLLDEELHSEIEIELQSEAWDSWGASEFRTALESHVKQAITEIWNMFQDSMASFVVTGMSSDQFMAVYEGAIDNAVLTVEDMPDEDLFHVFLRACERANAYWENQSSNSSYIDMNRIANGISLGDMPL